MRRRTAKLSASVALMVAVVHACCFGSGECHRDDFSTLWFSESTPVEFSDGNDFVYAPQTTSPEKASSRIDVTVRLYAVDEWELSSSVTNDMQAGVVRLRGVSGLGYAAITGDGWVRVGNASIVASDKASKVSACFDHAADPPRVEYRIDDQVLTNAEGRSSFVCAGRELRAGGVTVKGEGVVESVVGNYDVVGASVVSVAEGNERTLDRRLDECGEGTFWVSGGGTLVVGGSNVPPNGVARKLHVDGNSSLRFDLSDVSGSLSIVRLFNGAGSEFSIGGNVTVATQGEGVERISKLFMRGDDLEARIAERPSLGSEDESVDPFRISGSGGSIEARATIANAVEGFWYGLLSAESIAGSFALDHASVKQCGHTNELTITSSGEKADLRFYRISVSAEEPK